MRSGRRSRADRSQPSPNMFCARGSWSSCVIKHPAKARTLLIPTRTPDISAPRQALGDLTDSGFELHLKGVHVIGSSPRDKTRPIKLVFRCTGHGHFSASDWAGASTGNKRTRLSGIPGLL